jgi:hypothetical protein
LAGQVPATVHTPINLSPETAAQIRQILKNEHWRWDKVLALPEVTQSATRIFGTQMEKLRSYHTGSAQISDGVLSIDACMAHGCGNLGAILTIDLSTGKASGALHDEVKVTTFLGDYKTVGEAPRALRAWIDEQNGTLRILRGQRAYLKYSPGSRRIEQRYMSHTASDDQV